MPPVAYESRRKVDGSYEADVPEHPADRTRRELNHRWREFHRHYWLLGKRHDDAKLVAHLSGLFAIACAMVALIAAGVHTQLAWASGTAALLLLAISLGYFRAAALYLKAWRSLRSPGFGSDEL